MRSDIGNQGISDDPSLVPIISETKYTVTQSHSLTSDSGLIIVPGKKEAPLNSPLEFTLENRGPEKYEFISGNPFSVEYNGISGWILVAGHGGGTQAFWTLEPGNTSRKMVWNTGRVREYLDAGLIDKSLVKETGRFRICVHAYVGGYALNNEVVRCEEFVVIP